MSVVGSRAEWTNLMDGMLRRYLGNDTKAIAGYLARIKNGESVDAIHDELVNR